MRHAELGFAFSHLVRRIAPRARRGAALSCLLSFGVMNGATTARAADEFSTIAKGDPIYTQLATLRQGPWGGDTSATHDLTRYEVAIETAKAILKVNATHNANPNALPASRSALHALRALAVALHLELSRLDIDVAATLRLLDGLTSTSASTTEIASVPAPVIVPKLRDKDNSVARRLRVYSALSAVARDTDDPFGDNTNDFAAHGLLAPRSGLVGSAVSGSAAFAAAQPAAFSGTVKTGGAIGLTNWMQVRAGYAARSLTPGNAPWNGLRAPMLAGAREERSLGTGVDIALPLGLSFSGDVARVTAASLRNDSAGQRGTRYGGALNLSAWQNRLSLSANLSRLVPEDSQRLSTTATEFNLGVGVTDRLQLTLLYQQMFSASQPLGSDRSLAGGISVKF